jgi:uncharacterized membrane protein
MRRLFIAALVATALAAAPAPAAPTSADPVAHIACTNAKIGGQSKCIARGQYCARAQQRDYKRYGFSCSKRDARGRYHLT